MSAGVGRRIRGGVAGAAVVVAGSLLPLPSAAVEPAPGVAAVDGSLAEWGPADDVAALVGNDPPHVERGRVSLRYDCTDEVLYALVLAGPGLRLDAADADEAYLRFGNQPKLVSGTDGDDGEAPDAAWVDRRGGTAAGIELSTPLAPGSHDDLRVHAKLRDGSDDGYETLDLSPRYQDLQVACAADPVAAEVDPGAAADPRADPADPRDLARTGAPVLPALASAGALLLALGAALRIRRWGRPAGR